MSRALLKLLGKEQDKRLAVALRDLEIAAHTDTIDAKIVGDTLHAAHLLLREMGLDNDSTAKEVYQSLRVYDDLLSESTACVGLAIGDEVISFHPDDLALDETKSHPFAERSLTHFRAALADEIATRYKSYVARPKLLDEFLARATKK